VPTTTNYDAAAGQLRDIFIGITKGAASGYTSRADAIALAQVSATLAVADQLIHIRVMMEARQGA
jgi:hypothetical protein